MAASVTKVFVYCICLVIWKECLGKTLHADEAGAGIQEKPETFENRVRRSSGSFADTLITWKQKSENYLTPEESARDYLHFEYRQIEVPGERLARELICKDTNTMAAEAYKYEGIEIEVKTKKSRRYKYLVAIDRKGQIHWNEDLGWKKKIGELEVAKGVKTRAPERGFGGMSVIVKGDDCDKQDGIYKCTLFAHMPVKGKPGKLVLQQTRLELDVDGKLRCNNPNLPDDLHEEDNSDDNIGNEPDDKDVKNKADDNDDENKADDNDDVKIEPVEKPEEGGSGGVVIVAVILLLIGVAAGGFVFYKKKKAAEAKKAEEEKKKKELKKKKAAKKKKKGEAEGDGNGANKPPGSDALPPPPGDL